MLRQVLCRQKGGLLRSSLQNNNFVFSSIGSSAGNLNNLVITRNIHRPKTFEERVEQNYYTNVMKENDELDRIENAKLENEKDVTIVDRLFRFKPLKELTEDEIDDEWEGRPEHMDDDAYKMDTGDPDPRLLLGKSLLQLGKIHYRHADTLPPWFLAKQEEISNHRTIPQIRKCLKDWMIKNDRDLLDKYRKKQLKWGHLASKGDRNSLDIHTYGPDESIAYSHYFLTSRYAILNRVLGEIKTLHPTFIPKRVLDFGCGPATGNASMREVYKTSDFKYTGVDISQSMIDAGKIMTSEHKHSTFYTSSSEIMKHTLNTNERYDLIIASFSINELPNDPAKRIAIQMLFELLDVGGMLVIVETGNPYGSHTVRTARQFLLDSFNHINSSGRSSGPSSTYYDTVKHTTNTSSKSTNSTNTSNNSNNNSNSEAYDESKQFMSHKQASRADRDRRKENKRIDTEEYKVIEMMLPPPKTGNYSYEELGAYVVAPCTHDRACPLANGVWCSFSQKVYSGVIRKANEEKFSYLVMQKRPKSSAYNHTTGSDRKKDTTESATVGTASKQRGQWGKWLESSPDLSAEGSGDSPTADLDTVANPTPLAVLQRFMDTDSAAQATKLVDTLIDEVDWEEYNPPLYREEWGRLVRSPIKSKGHITVDVCTPEGQVLRTALSKANLVNVPSLYTALRKTTWGGLFPIVGGDIERSGLSRNAKGTRYKGNSAVDKDVVVFDKYGKSSKDSSSGSSTSVSKKSKKKIVSDSDSSDEENVYNIPGLPKGLVPTGEMIAASKSARYRKLLEAQAQRDDEEHERLKEMELNRRKVSRSRDSSGGGASNTSVSTGTSTSGSVVEDGGEGTSGRASRGKGFSAQLERLKAKRALKDTSSSTNTFE